MSHQFDIVIRNGTIFDGTGSEGYVADVAISGDKIAQVGVVAGRGAREIDATGLMVTPGFVDIHTHYDGQVIWESRLNPSSGHGVTTVLMGNCGVGFAPCRAEDHDRLIKLMEGVEDIPGVVLTEGLTWEWETFPEYLDAVEARPHDINVAAYLPHSPLRVYAMGERAAAGEAATPEDLERMGQITREAMRAGALGFASSRTLFHRSSSGDLIPTLDAGEEELLTIARAIQETSDGIIQIANDYKNNTDIEGEFNLIKRVAKATNRPLTLPMAQVHSAPEAWREIVARIEQANREGMRVSGQALPRGVGLLLGLELSAHPFTFVPAYKDIQALPLADRLARMRDPDVRARIINDLPGETQIPLFQTTRRFAEMFEMADPLDYEPLPETSIAARAARMDISPEELAYDILIKHEGHAALFLPFANYAYGNLDSALELFRHKDIIVGLGDGGAHNGIICDASYSTFLLSHWTRDRSRGEKVTVSEVIKALTNDTSVAVGLKDRGRLAPGYNADVNIIDYDRLALHAPTVAFDLPAGGRRLTQKADGFVATIVNGEVVYENGVATGALPGRLVRGQKIAPDEIDTKMATA